MTIETLGIDGKNVFQLHGVNRTGRVMLMPWYANSSFGHATALSYRDHILPDRIDKIRADIATRRVPARKGNRMIACTKGWITRMERWLRLNSQPTSHASEHGYRGASGPALFPRPDALRSRTPITLFG